MINVLDRSTGEISVFPGEGWLKSTRTCPAPCCDIACEDDGPKSDCPHSEHGTEGFCLVRRESDVFRCEQFFPAAGGIEFSDCVCSGVEACEHSQELRARAAVIAQEKAARPAGVQLERFLASRTPQAPEE
jgi:hypothetical protein